MKRTLIILAISIFISKLAFAEPLLTKLDSRYLKLNGTNQSSWRPTTSLVTNLNADLWDGYNFSDYLDQSVKTTSSPTFSGLSIDANTLYVDSVNDRLGIKTFYPAYTLDCNGDINTSTVYRIGGFTVLQSNGANLSLGQESGSVNIGNWNTFLGTRAGWYNTGSYNTFLGNGTGSYNTGNDNTFVGTSSGWANTTGSRNAFFGNFSGHNNTTGGNNTFLGENSGMFNTEGHQNTFVGNFCGYYNTTGEGNTFVGFYGGSNITTGNNNVFLGTLTGGSSGSITSSIGIGYNTTVTANNQLVVGSANPYGGQITDSYWGSGVTKINPASFTFNATGGEGTDNPGADLKIAGGKGTGAANGGKIIFQTAPAGISGATPNALVDRVTITSDGNVAVGTEAPTAVLDVNGTTGYNQLRIRTAYTPIGTSDSNGNAGDIAWDDDYVYIKTSVGWKRAALSTW